ncbi:oligosaccharide flippase family protein [Acidimicrobiaceae bacterium AH-315-P05]|nr:oligosaccharide flippase family protein [Acidimicrobiaceae bacterium AH-315-P05]
MTRRSIPANTFALILARVFTAVMSLTTAGIAARQLGEAAFGTYASVLVAGFLANTLVTFGTDTLIVRSTSRGDASHVVRNSIGLQLVIVSVVVLAAVVTTAFLGPRALPLLVQSVGLIFGVWATASSAVLRGRERMDLASTAASTGAVVGLLGAIVANATDGSVTAFIAAGVVGQAVVAGLGSLFGSRAVRSQRWRHTWRPQWSGEVWAEARPFAGMVAATAVATSVGILSLKLTGSGTATGQYAAANRLSEGLQLAPAAVFGAAFPAMSRGIHLKHQYVSSLRYLTASLVGLVALTVVFADQIIEITFGGFDQSSTLLRILSLGVLPALVRVRWSFELLAVGAEREVAKLAFAGAAMSIALTFGAAILWGSTMVAIAFVSGLVIQALLLRSPHHRTIGRPF